MEKTTTQIVMETLARRGMKLADMKPITKSLGYENLFVVFAEIQGKAREKHKVGIFNEITCEYFDANTYTTYHEALQVFNERGIKTRIYMKFLGE